MKQHNNLFKLAACSSMTLTSKTGKNYWFRTCDYMKNIWAGGAHIVSFPEGYEIKFTDKENKTPSKYKILGVTYNKTNSWILDGINSKGLVGGLLFLDEGTSAYYAQDNYTGVIGMDIVTKLLSLCATVDDVIQEASKIQVLNIPIFKGQYTLASMHYIFTDETGNTVILEADDINRPGIFRIYQKNENIGVLTNSPPYNRQLNNLSWYISQSPELKYGYDGKALTHIIIGGKEIKADKNAKHISVNGTFPGSYSSYDRFIRLSMLKALNDNGVNFSDEEMLAKGSGIMSSIYEPNNNGIYDYRKLNKKMKPIGNKNYFSQYMVMYNTSEKELYLKPFDAVTWTKYNLHNCSDEILKTYEANHSGSAGILEGC
ncbi:MAG: linear amide C-N hydrolase [Clostridium sp.]